MASGLQCPGCGHVHPAGLPEIARGDAVFRCYGCYRPLSVPEGWTGRPSSRPAPPLSPTEEAPPGAGTRDARAARLSARRGSTLTRPAGGPVAGADQETQLSPVATPGNWATAPPAGAPAGADGARPLGSATPPGAEAPVRAPVRLLVWTAAFTVGLAVAAYVLRKVGVLDVDAVLDLYAGTGPKRFAILLALLPLWALVSATIAHFTLERLSRRRRRPRRPAARPPAGSADRFTTP